MGVSVSSSSSSLAGSSKTIDSRKDDFVDKDDVVVDDEGDEDVDKLPNEGLSVLWKCLKKIQLFCYISCY